MPIVQNQREHSINPHSHCANHEGHYVMEYASTGHCDCFAAHSEILTHPTMPTHILHRHLTSHNGMYMTCSIIHQCHVHFQAWDFDSQFCIYLFPFGLENIFLSLSESPGWTLRVVLWKWNERKPHNVLDNCPYLQQRESWFSKGVMPSKTSSTSWDWQDRALSSSILYIVVQQSLQKKRL
jgi:hypothetical protein